LLAFSPPHIYLPVSKEYFPPMKKHSSRFIKLRKN
jgi:hypothetical protein